MSNKNAEAEPVACDHEWTDDGGFLLVCTKCEAQEDRDPKWRDMESAPTDGTLLRLLVNFDEHPTEDADEAPTIGANNFDNDGEDVWRFAGWCWAHDHFTQGIGTPVGWLPMIETNPGTAELDRVTAERDVLQQRLNAADEQLDAQRLRAVVLPARLDLPHRDEFESADQYAAATGEAKKWNECLDTTAALNTPK